MNTIKQMEEKYRQPSLDMLEGTFTDWSDPEEGALVRALVQEMRGMDTYVPELELIMVDDTDAVIGYVMFSRFHLEGRYRDELLLLSPVGVRTDRQRQHISRDLIEYGFQKAQGMGFTVVIVEGNPQNYRSRGFVTSADHGIVAEPQIQLPSPECLMVKELVPGALAHMHGSVSYADYKTLK